jgi:ADP-ribose pyrophosphatase YjhB (NUDIX family)
MNFCSRCGAGLTQRTPAGDDRPRFVCDQCQAIHYQNPRMVVGTIPEWEKRILLCRRAIAPRAGRWTLPAGYLENGETMVDGARRETREEAGARLEELTPFALFDLPFINQVYLMFRGFLATTAHHPGVESLEARLFSEADIPWDDLAFVVVRETLKRYFSDRDAGRFRLHTGTISPPTDTVHPKRNGKETPL